MTRIGVAVFVYQKQIVPDCALYDTLGVIRQNDDGTWGWWRWPSKFFPEWVKYAGEGVEPSESEARVMVLEGWL